MISAQKKKEVLHLHQVEGKSAREIAKIKRMSLRDIDRIFKEERGEVVSWSNKKPKDNSKNFAAMNRLFMKHMSPLQVSIDLNVSLEIVLKEYKNYLIAIGLERIVQSYEQGGEYWLKAVNEIVDAMKKLRLPPELAQELLRFTLRMQEAGNSIQMLKDEEARINEANLKQILYMSDEKQEHEKRISELRKEEKRTRDRTEAEKIKPENTKNINQSDDNKKLKDEEKLQTFLNSIEPLARELNPYKK